MEEKITKELFDELVQVAMIELSPEEAISLRDEMNHRMSILNELEAVPLDENTEPMVYGSAYPLEIRAELREDEWHPNESAAEIVNRAPRSEDGYVVSPDVPHQKLG